MRCRFVSATDGRRSLGGHRPACRVTTLAASDNTQHGASPAGISTIACQVVHPLVVVPCEHPFAPTIMRHSSNLAVALPFLFSALLATGAKAQSAVQHVDYAAIPAQAGHSMVYDEARERIVMFGKGQTWEWNGNEWNLHQPLHSPSAREYAGMAYDPSRRRVVLFGGTDGSNSLQDTWQWDGVDWALQVSLSNPGPSRDHAMAFDPIGSRILLHGGNVAGTWAWDGAAWTQLTPTTAPSVGPRVGMATDTTRQRIVMHAFGAWPFLGQETWEWDGSNWLLQQPANALPLWLQRTLTFDVLRQRVVAFGFGSQTTPWPGQATWEWDGINWVNVDNGHGPMETLEGQLAFDTARGETIAFGGMGDFYDPIEPAATWSWDGASWQLRSATTGHATSARGLALDTQRGEVVALDSYLIGMGGYGGCAGTCPQVWRAITKTWNGQRWNLSQPNTQPDPRTSHAATFDSSRAVTVLFGGRNTDPFTASAHDDTWEWDGATWMQRPTTMQPGPRAEHAMAFDAQRGVTVLFGGGTPWSGPATVLLAIGDTWEWDGSQWQQASPLVSPAPRVGHAMVFDPVRARTVLFGGHVPFQGLIYNDTWEWNGTQWLQIQTATTPPGGGDFAMAWDPNRQRTVLYVGNELWEFDGSDWIRRLSTVAIPPANGNAMVFDVVHNSMLVVGDDHSTRLIGDVAAPQLIVLGTGCNGTNDPPILNAPMPHLGDPDFVVALDHAPATAPMLFALSPTQATLPLGNGCTWFLGFHLLLAPATTSSLGHADFAVSIPFDLALRGLDVHMQAAVLDTPLPPIGLALSSALTLRLGD